MIKLIKQTWLRLSEAGTDNYKSNSEKKQNRIINQILIIFIFYFSILGFGLICQYFIIIYYNYSVYYKYVFYYLPAIIPVPIATILTFYYRIKYKNDYLIIIPGFLGALSIALLSLYLGKEFPLHLYLLIYTIAPLLIYKKNNLKTILIIASFITIIILIVYWWHFTYTPLFPPPEYLIKSNTYLLVFMLNLGAFLFVYYFWNQNEKNEALLIIEQNKSEKVILNILPEVIARELKEQGYTKPKLYKEVSVLFTDFVGFTQIAENLSPEELVDELDKCFSYFDSVSKRYNLEKLKTIGDAYMCAGGIPKENSTHSIDCVLAALEIQNFMNQMKKIKEAQNQPYWELRLGINTGSLVAGVVGEMKFAYDIWGDTVNTASRMESSGVAGKINISLDTYNLVKHLFDCEYRGKILAKRKGEIDMYFVIKIKPEFSRQGDGKVPNDKFQEIYNKMI